MIKGFRFSIAQACSGMWELAIVPDDTSISIRLVSRGSYSEMEVLRDYMQKMLGFLSQRGWFYA